MKIAPIAGLLLLPALAFANGPARYVVHQGRHVSEPRGESPQRSFGFVGRTGGRGLSGGRGGASVFRGARSSAAASSGFGGFSRALSGRATAFHFSTTRSPRRLSSVDGDGAGAPAWATPGALIRTAGQPPAYSNPGNGGLLSVEGGGFISIDQSRANDVGRSLGLTWGAPQRASTRTGGGSGASSNGPAFDPSF